MSAVHISYNLILTCLVHLHILHILEPSPVLKFLPEHITRLVMTSNINTISPFKILIPNSRLVHSTVLLPTAVAPCTYVALWWKQLVTFNRFRTVWATVVVVVVVYPYLCNKTNKKSMFEGYYEYKTSIARNVMLMWLM